ncbi:MAG: hypothetical protein WCI73_13665, partial [Phycisphaerae bacterium]
YTGKRRYLLWCITAIIVVTICTICVFSRGKRQQRWNIPTTLSNSATTQSEILVYSDFERDITDLAHSPAYIAQNSPWPHTVIISKKYFEFNGPGPFNVKKTRIIEQKSERGKAYVDVRLCDILNSGDNRYSVDLIGGGETPTGQPMRYETLVNVIGVKGKGISITIVPSVSGSFAVACLRIKIGKKSGVMQLGFRDTGAAWLVTPAEVKNLSDVCFVAKEDEVTGALIAKNGAEPPLIIKLSN